MATIKFLLQSNSDNAPIYLRLSLGRAGTSADGKPLYVSYKRKTGLTINSKDWSKATGKPKQTTTTNKNTSTDLDSLSAKIYKDLNSASSDGIAINGEWLKHQIDLHFKRITEHEQSELVSDAIQNIIDTTDIRKNNRGGTGLSKSRINSYNSLLNIFNEYQKTKRFKVKDIDVKFSNAFLKYLINEKGYSKSYAMKKIADLKTCCADAETNGIETSPQLSKINTARPQNESIIYLTPSELKQIEDADITNEALQNARKWLLLGCNIGQRGGDLLKLNENNFVTRNGYEVIELTQQKGGKNVTIPVLETTKDILETGLPYKISIQKLNDYLKEVCRLAEIDEPTQGGVIQVIEKGKGNKQKRKVYGMFAKHKLITSHVCRRSFSTNNYGILPTPLIMSITAHSTEKMFLNYIGKNSLDYAQQIADFYTLQAQKAKKEPQLTIIKNASNN